MKIAPATLAAAFGVLTFCALPATAGEPPPQGSTPLSTILRSVESQHLGTIAEAEFDDGLWQVKACQATSCDKLYLDPTTGKEVRRRKSGSESLPPAGAMALSAVIQRAESSQRGRVSEVEFDHGHWEVELRNGTRKTKLLINPATGQELR